MAKAFKCDFCSSFSDESEDMTDLRIIEKIPFSMQIMISKKDNFSDKQDHPDICRSCFHNFLLQAAAQMNPGPVCFQANK